MRETLERDGLPVPRWGWNGLEQGGASPACDNGTSPVACSVVNPLAIMNASHPNGSSSQVQRGT